MRLLLSDNGTQCIEDVCRLNHHKLRFFLIGDWGGQDTPPYVTKAQVTVARTMDKMGDERKAHCVLSVGDHFYMSGVQSVHSDRFQVRMSYRGLNSPVNGPAVLEVV